LEEGDSERLLWTQLQKMQDGGKKELPTEKRKLYVLSWTISLLNAVDRAKICH